MQAAGSGAKNEAAEALSGIVIVFISLVKKRLVLIFKKVFGVCRLASHGCSLTKWTSVHIDENS